MYFEARLSGVLSSYYPQFYSKFVLNIYDFAVKKPFFYHYYHSSITPSITIKLFVSMIVNINSDRSDRIK